LIGGSTPGPGNIGFAYDTYSADEGASPFYITLARTNGNLGAVSVGFKTVTVPGGATDSGTNADFGLASTYANPRWGTSQNGGGQANTRMVSDGLFGFNSSTLPFPSSEADVFIDLSSDSEIESDEEINLQLSRPKSAEAGGFDMTDPDSEFSLGGEHIALEPALGRSSATLSIIDRSRQQAILEFSAPEFVISENATNVQVSVTRTGGSGGSVSVQYATADGTATKNLDYLPKSGRLDFQDGVTLTNITIGILDSSAVEPDETFNVRLFNPSIAAKLGTLTNATVRIIDNDYLPGRLNFTIAFFTVVEGNPVAVISVARTGGSLGIVSVQCSTIVGGTATPGEDYSNATTNLTWNSGEVAIKTFTVPILNDTLVENPETVLLQLQNSTRNGNLDGAILGTVTNAILTIVDEDHYGEFGFSASRYYANENSRDTVVTIVRNNGTAGSVSLTLFVTNEASITSSLLSFVPGERTKNFVIPIADNSDPNPDLVLGLGLANPSPTG
ncbi:MAG: Calx-beta domain-containing protein, partial [Verrucomicrobiota bacterium]